MCQVTHDRAEWCVLCTVMPCCSAENKDVLCVLSHSVAVLECVRLHMSEKKGVFCVLSYCAAVLECDMLHKTERNGV